VSHRAKISAVPEWKPSSDRCGSAESTDPRILAQFAVDADQLFEVLADLRIPDDQKRAFFSDKTGTIAGNNLATDSAGKSGPHSSPGDPF